MEDGLHPTAKGMDVLLSCIKQRLLPPRHHHQKRTSLY
jgi:lysophospholipase L1-like esterase